MVAAYTSERKREMTRKHLMGLAVLAIVGWAGAGAPGSAPLDMDLIISDAHAEECDHDYSKASATVRVRETNKGTTEVTIKVKGGKPNHIHTVWLRVSKSPITCAGATPLAGTGDIQTIIDNANSASTAGANAFMTNAAGNATLHVALDFLLSDGLYPFSKYDSDLSDAYIGHTPFTLRVISHCTDDEQHGLVPGVHEPTFQISLN
jgi:hypothetical protein